MTPSRGRMVGTGWVPEGNRSRAALHAAGLFRPGRIRNRAKALRLFMEVERRHPREPHWYLALLATDPSAQGRGLGTALLAPVLEQCDREGIPAYTETQKKDNVSWYARSGFDVASEITLPGTPTVWCLARTPWA